MLLRPSRLFECYGHHLGLTKHNVKKFAKWIEHLEHGGGTTVGIDFIVRHSLNAFMLAAMVVVFAVVHAVVVSDS